MPNYKEKKRKEKERKASGKDVGYGIVVSITHDSMYGYLALTRSRMTITDRFHIRLPKPMSHEEIYERAVIAFGILPNPVTSKVNVEEIIKLGLEEYERRRT